MKIHSNFLDYYDEEAEKNESNIHYKRLRGKYTRGQDLAFLEQLGIKVNTFGTIRDMGSTVERFIVYTNPYEHGCIGKEIYTYGEVSLQYNNYLVSPFIEDYGGKTIKYLQIGERRFRLMMYNENYRSTISTGKIIDVDELPRQYNSIIGLPIYSIDYISKNGEMIAIDYNRVQKLDILGFDKILTKEEVIEEIEKAMAIYSRV